MDETEFKSAIKQILLESRNKTLKNVRQILEFGDEYGDVDMGGWSDLAKLAGSPGDVVKATMGSVANVSNKVRTLLSMVLRSIPSLIIPGVATKFDKILQDESRRQSEIERMYPEIFSIARKGFPKDGELFAFMVSPAMLMTWALGRMGADVTLDLIDAFSGESPNVMAKTKVLRRRTSTTRESFNILEAPAQKKADIASVKQFLADKDFVNEFSQLETVKEISEAVRGSKNNMLHDVIQTAKDISEANSVDELSLLGINFQLDDTKKQELENAGALDEVLQKAKSSAVEHLIKKVNDQVSEFESAGIPKDADIFRAHAKTLSKLKKQLTNKGQNNFQKKN